MLIARLKKKNLYDDDVYYPRPSCDVTKNCNKYLTSNYHEPFAKYIVRCKQTCV